MRMKNKRSDDLVRKFKIMSPNVLGNAVFAL